MILKEIKGKIIALSVITEYTLKIVLLYCKYLDGTNRMLFLPSPLFMPKVYTLLVTYTWLSVIPKL